MKKWKEFEGTTHHNRFSAGSSGEEQYVFRDLGLKAPASDQS